MANNADAIDLMNEVEQLKARIDLITRKIREENERLRAELYDRPGSKQDWVDRCYGVEARLDAALALHTETEREGGLLCVCGWSWRDGSCQSPTVKALKGEA